MNKTLKRALSLILAVVMMMSFATVVAYAVDLNPSADAVTVKFSGGVDNKGSVKSYKGHSITLPNPGEKEDYKFLGWKIDGKLYQAGDTFEIDKDLKGDTITAKAIWEDKNGKNNDSSESSSSKVDTDAYTFTFKPNGGSGTSKKIKAKKENGNYYVTLPTVEECGFTKEGYVFAGWMVEGTKYTESNPLQPGEVIYATKDYTVKAVWKEGNPKITFTYQSGKESNSNDVVKQYDSGVAMTLLKPKTDLGFVVDSQYSFAGWSINGKIYASGASYTPTANTVAVATWYIPSSSSSVPEPVPSSSSVPESSSEPEESIPEEEPEPEQPEYVFEPVTLSYNISGDIPVSKVEYYLSEDIGATPSLMVSALSASSAADKTTKAFIESGDALAAFDLSLLAGGENYNGHANGTVTYSLNGTQTGKSSNYADKLLAMVHIVPLSQFEGETYYKADGNKAVLVNKNTGETAQVKGLTFKEEDGVYRPVVEDVDMFGSFAYLSSEGYISEVKISPDANAQNMVLSTSSLSPVLLVWIEQGVAQAARTGIPVWVWIVVGVVLLILVLIIVFYVIGKKRQKENSRKRMERINGKSVPASSSGITGFDD